MTRDPLPMRVNDRADRVLDALHKALDNTHYWLDNALRGRFILPRGAALSTETYRGQAERNAFELGWDVGALKGPRPPLKPPETPEPPRHLHTV